LLFAQKMESLAPWLFHELRFLAILDEVLGSLVMLTMLWAPS